MDEDIAARWKRAVQRVQQFGGVLPIQDVMQDAAEQQADRTIPVQVLADVRVLKDPGGTAEVTLHHDGAGIVGEQRPGVGKSDRVIVDVDHPAPRVEPFCYFMDIVSRGQSGADVNELPDACIFDQVTDHPAEQCPLRPYADLNGGKRFDDPVAQRAVGGEIVLSAKKVVIHPGDMGLQRIESAGERLLAVHQ